jgi:hypothetical protein
MAACFGEWAGLGEITVRVQDEDRGDGACAWAWNMQPGTITFHRQCLEELPSDVDVAWVVLHEVCHLKGYPDESDAWYFCMDSGWGQSGCLEDL